MTQELIGISQNSTITRIHPPLASAVNAFAENGVHGPKLKPLKFAFEHPWTHAWNQEIANKLVNHFMRQESVADDETETLYNLCRQQFEVLRNHFRREQPQGDEDEVALKSRLWDEKMWEPA